MQIVLVGFIFWKALKMALERARSQPGRDRRQVHHRWHMQRRGAAFSAYPLPGAQEERQRTGLRRPRVQLNAEDMASKNALNNRHHAHMWRLFAVHSDKEIESHA